MLFSGEARESFLDSFLSGFFLGEPAGVAKALLPEGDSGNPKKTQGKDTPDQTGQPKTDPRLTQPEATTPGETVRPTTASHPGDAPRRVRLTEPDVKPETTTEDPKPQITETLPQEQPRTQPDRAADSGTQPEIPYFTTDIRTNERDGMWTEADADLWTQSDAETQQKPLRHEDQPRSYPDGDTSPSANPEVLTASSPKSGPVADMAVVPKPKEQLISELVPKISKPGITPGRATIAAEQMYAEAEKRYGSNADTVLEMFQPGQDPRKFLDGIETAYLSGKMGSRTALENSGAAAYLSDSQRELAFELGERAGRGLEKGRNDVRIMEVSRFNTKGDPMREVTGPGVKSHPAEIQQMCSEMEGYGVEIVRRGSGMAYSPGILPGSPGQFIIEEDASYSAWLHEYKHFCDIRDAGFPGMRIFMDTEKCIRMEIDAYSIEISMAESMNRPDIAERLRELMKNEVSRFVYSIDD